MPFFLTAPCIIFTRALCLHCIHHLSFRQPMLLNSIACYHCNGTSGLRGPLNGSRRRLKHILTAIRSGCCDFNNERICSRFTTLPHPFYERQNGSSACCRVFRSTFDSSHRVARVTDLSRPCLRFKWHRAPKYFDWRFCAVCVVSSRRRMALCSR